MHNMRCSINFVNTAACLYCNVFLSRGVIENCYYAFVETNWKTLMVVCLFLPFSKEDLQSLTVVILKKFLTQYELDTAGRKAELVERLGAHIEGLKEQKGAEAAADEEANFEGTEETTARLYDPFILSTMKLSHMRAISPSF